MSKISTIIQQLRTVIPTYSRFSGKNELFNSVNVERNPEDILESGWGIRLADSSIGALAMYNTHSESRSLDILITKESIHRESDIDSFMGDQLELMEDHNQLITELVKSNQIDVGGEIVKIDFVANSGIELIEDKKRNFLFTTTTIAVDIFEETGC